MSRSASSSTFPTRRSASSARSIEGRTADDGQQGVFRGCLNFYADASITGATSRFGASLAWNAIAAAGLLLSTDAGARLTPIARRGTPGPRPLREPQGGPCGRAPVPTQRISDEREPAAGGGLSAQARRRLP